LEKFNSLDGKSHILSKDGRHFAQLGLGNDTVKIWSIFLDKGVLQASQERQETQLFKNVAFEPVRGNWLLGIHKYMHTNEHKGLLNVYAKDSLILSLETFYHPARDHKNVFAFSTQGNWLAFVSPQGEKKVQWRSLNGNSKTFEQEVDSSINSLSSILLSKF